MNHGKLTGKQLRIIASLRDQKLDVSLGTITPAEYVATVEATILGGTPLPTDVCEFATRCRNAVKVEA
jgi:hypothetical protein